MPFGGDALVGLLPEIVGSVFLIAVLLGGVFSGESSSGVSGGLAALGTFAVFGVSAGLLVSGFSGEFFGGGYVVDGFSLYFKLIVSACAFLTVIAAIRWAGETGDAAEYMTLIISVAVGAMLLVSMRDLFGIFLALELATIPSYALVAFDRSRRESSEGGMKYLITGVIASSVLLYGMVLIYGVAGSANLSDVAETFSGNLTPVGLVGVGLLIAGFAFKVSAVPFHFWTPDAYQGAHTTAAGFLSVAPKAAFFAGLLRILVEGLPGAAATWTALIGVFAILTMFVGNLSALRQRNVRRMLAFSSVAHSGYILAAFAAFQGGAQQLAVQAVMIYAAAYAVMNLGAFFVVEVVGEETKSFNGLFKVRPALALAMGVFMVSLVGLPPFAGFFGKAWVILAGVQSGSVLVYIVIGALVVNSVISLPYYLGIFRNMFLEEPVGDSVSRAGDGGVLFSIYALAILTTIFIVFAGALAALTGGAGLV